MNLLGVSLGLWIVVFTIPLIIGIILLVKYFSNRKSGHPIHLLAALFTLKPLLATPAWLLITDSLGAGNMFTLSMSILPGVGLTALIVFAFRSTYFRLIQQIPRRLLIFDCVRWLNTFLALGIALAGGLPVAAFVSLPMAFVGMAIPTIYAIFAYSSTRDLSIVEAQTTLP